MYKVQVIAMENTFKIEVIEFTDPACTWCWGSEPILRRLETSYEGNLKVSFNMGGLVDDITTFKDDYNNIGGDIKSVNKQIADHWVEASEKHGMPVEIQNFNLFSEERPSTYPMNIAYKAAQLQEEELANKYLRRIREAVATEGKEANSNKVLVELAVECGLNKEKFVKDFTDGTAEKAFMKDLDYGRKYGVQVFPSYIVRGNNGKECLLRGFHPYDTFKNIISEITNGGLNPVELEGTKDTILKFITKYEEVAEREITTMFRIETKELDELLQSLVAQNHVTKKKVGNGYFISSKK